MIEKYNLIMQMKYSLYLFFALAVMSFFSYSCMEDKISPLEGKVICIDPGHGGTALTDSFRVGPAGEREEWINLRVALKLAALLEKKGANPVLTRTSDEQVGLKARADAARQIFADVFISIHHNATADSLVNFPIIYFHGNASENRAGVHLGKFLAKNINAKLYDEAGPVSLVSDHVIFPGGGTAVLRYSYGIPGVIGEASFFTNPDEEERLKQEEYNQLEAQAYFIALQEYFASPPQPVERKYSIIKLPRFEVFQEAERMDPAALLWRKYYDDGERLAQLEETDSLKTALDLFTKSVRYFPDSWLARDAHIKRAEILKKLGRLSDANTAMLRVEEFYVTVD
jgi:N-acetylmuramoyl-L-alanine amidase